MKSYKHGRKMTLNGITDSIGNWARKLGISDVTINRRLNAGMSPEEAIKIVKRGHPTRTR